MLDAYHRASRLVMVHLSQTPRSCYKLEYIYIYIYKCIIYLSIHIVGQAGIFGQIELQVKLNRFAGKNADMPEKNARMPAFSDKCKKLRENKKKTLDTMALWLPLDPT